MKSFRTHTCGQLTAKDLDSEIVLSGWVNSRRDHGGLIFVDLRDRYGVTQIVADPSANEAAHKMLDSVRGEYVIKITGKVRKRPEGMDNSNLVTGEIEVILSKVKILNKSQPTPFEISSDKPVNEELRLKYRYLDLRRTRMQKNIMMRHKVINFIRNFMNGQDFLEIETPMLIKGTPEGSREYVVPARLHPGKFYVLPQSPQQLKQLCMVAGIDRYFQIARCFRDEDQRGDRQPEFTQLDMELSFVDEEDVMKVNEDLMLALVKEVMPKAVIKEDPFPHLSWHEAMSRYGSDKPDLRFDMEIVDVSDVVKDAEFKVFAEALKLEEGCVKALRVQRGSEFTRKQIDYLTDTARIYGAKGLAYITKANGELKSPIAKFFTEDQLAKLVETVGLEDDDIVFFGADKFKIVCESLGAVRLACGDHFGLRDPNLFAFCWVVDFPMFEWSEEDGRLVAAHHPFCSIKDEDVDLLETDPRKVRAKAYDFVMNGNEVGGGSIRIHEPELQSKIFEILGIAPQEAKQRFGHMLEAFTYGAPPHGGIAWGLDRVIMVFAGEPNIREVIAFPKDQQARDLMLDAPSTLPKEQIDEVHVKVVASR
jgi:aspartyl-tRNA synthetase